MPHTSGKEQRPMHSTYSLLIRSIICSKENIKNTSFACIASGIGSLLEGVSYGMIILAFTAITQNQNLLPKYIQHIEWIDNMSNDTLLIISLSTAILVQVCRGLCLFFSSFFFACITDKGMQFLLTSINERILTASYRSILNYKQGTLTDLVSSIPIFFPHWMHLFNQLISNFFLIIVALVVLLFFSTKLLLIVLSIFGLAGFLQKMMIKIIGLLSIQAAQEGAIKTELSSQMIYGIKQIHLFNFQKKMKEKMDHSIKTTALIHKKISCYNGMVTGLNDIIAIIAISSAIAAGYFILNDQQPDTAFILLLSFLPISLRLSMRMIGFSNSLVQILMYKGRLQAITEFLNEMCDTQEIDSLNKQASFTNEIRLENLSFQYDQGTDHTIKDCHLTIKKNTVTALVGPSGSGKTTLIDLLLKFHKPSIGSIWVDGENLNTICSKSWRSLIGIVSQNPYLFNDTIEYNIRMGCPDASIEAVYEAAKLAGAHPFIMALEHGYTTKIGETAIRLSGGERQRIALARALIRKPRLLILDEATSSLDNESEQFIKSSLSSLRATTTLIVIAHRLSTITDSDIIHVIEKGGVVESGDHQALLALQGRYTSLWNAPQ